MITLSPKIKASNYPKVAARFYDNPESLNDYVLPILEREKWEITEENYMKVVNQLEMEL